MNKKLMVGALAACACLNISNAEAARTRFSISSPQLENGKYLALDQVYDGFGCTGRNISPELNWFNAPEGTKSFAVTVFDPDAPTGSGWWHWIVFDIPVTANSLRLGASGKIPMLPKGAIEVVNDFGKVGYGGACPPKGDRTHSYIFTVYALSVETLDLDPNAPAALVSYRIREHALANATIKMRYENK